MSTWLSGTIQTRFRTIDGLSIRYAESKQLDDHALLLSPWPERLYAFEPTWLRLAEHTHLVAVDLPGFGHSRRSDALLSPRAMGRGVGGRRSPGRVLADARPAARTPGRARTGRPHPLRR